jgi:hypothetical protein
MYAHGHRHRRFACCCYDVCVRISLWRSCLSEEARLCWFMFQFALWQSFIRRTSVWGGDQSRYELHALCRNLRIVARTHEASNTIPRGWYFIVSKSHPAFRFPGTPVSLVFLILGTKYKLPRMWLLRLVLGREVHRMTECFVVFLAPQNAFKDDTL